MNRRPPQRGDDDARLLVEGGQVDEAVVEDGDQLTLMLGSGGSVKITLRGIGPVLSEAADGRTRGASGRSGHERAKGGRSPGRSAEQTAGQPAGQSATASVNGYPVPTVDESGRPRGGRQPAFPDGSVPRGGERRVATLRGSDAVRLPALDQRDRISLVAVDLGVAVFDGGAAGRRGGRGTRPFKQLLDEVTFAAEPGHVVAIVGPSGAGKSTVVRALTGSSDFDGEVLYNGVPLDADTISDLRYQIGYVPQEDVLHQHLPLRQALMFAARLRLPDVSSAERQQVVAQILSELLLVRQAETPIGALSGGERKRASVAIELITRPPVLFLDEPTTGLDPDAERLLFRVLRGLADNGHTIIMITHAPAILPACDRLLVVGRGARGGGRLAFYGSPRQCLEFFSAGRNDYAYVYERLNAGDVDWSAVFRHHRSYHDNVTLPVAVHRRARPLPAPRLWAQAMVQLAVLAHRNAATLWGDRRFRAALAVQAPAMVVVIVAILGWHNLSGDPAKNPRGLLAFTTAAALAMGLINSCREIVKEAPILHRERTVGLNVLSYLGAKFVTIAVICLVQSLLLGWVMFWQDGAEAGVVLGSRLAEVVLLLFVCSLTAVAMGLGISGAVKSDATALVMVPILLVSQLLLSGAFLDIENRWPMRLVAKTQPAYWTFAGLAASNDLVRIDPACAAPRPAPVGASGTEGAAPASSQPACSSHWHHDAGALGSALVWLGVLLVGYLLAAAAVLRRRGQILSRRG